MTSIAPIDVTESRRHRRAFIDVPFQLYGADRCWVPPIRAQQARLLRADHPVQATIQIQTFLASRSGRPIGRIMAIDNPRYRNHHQVNEGHFGFFDCPDDPAVAAHLIDAAANWLGDRGRDRMVGPFCPTTNYQSGVLVEGFDVLPSIMMSWNPPYYPALYEMLGFRCALELYSYQLPRTSDLPERLQRLAHRIEQRTKPAGQIRCRELDLNRWDEELRSIWQLFQEAREQNWGFMPATNEEFHLIAKDLRRIATPQSALMVEDGRLLVACMIVLEDLNQVLVHNRSGSTLGAAWHLMTKRRHIQRVRVPLFAIRASHRKLGLETMLMVKIRDQYKYRRDIEASWVQQHNVLMLRPLQTLGFRKTRTHCIYAKDL